MSRQGQVANAERRCSRVRRQLRYYGSMLGAELGGGRGGSLSCTFGDCRFGRGSLSKGISCELGGERSLWFGRLLSCSGGGGGIN